jgi:hypothetical protein
MYKEDYAFSNSEEGATFLNKSFNMIKALGNLLKKTR